MVVDDGARLTVNPSELADGLRLLGKFVSARYHGDARISFEDGSVVIDVNGVAARATAEGNWPGAAKVSAAFVRGLATATPTAAPVVFRVEKGVLHVRGMSAAYSAPCVWDGEGTAIRLPVNPSFTTVLALRLAYSDEEIERSGFGPIVRDAERRRDRLVAQAVTVLKPLGVKRSHLDRLVSEVLKAEAGRP